MIVRLLPPIQIVVWGSSSARDRKYKDTSDSDMQPDRQSNLSTLISICIQQTSPADCYCRNFEM